MFVPGYYKSNYRALRFREVARMQGLRRAPFDYVATRFKRPDASGWMPSLSADTECRREDLSGEFWQATKLHRLAFERLGYSDCGFQRVAKTLNPYVRDTGGIRYLDPTRRYFGHLFYHRLRVASTGAELIRTVISFTAVFEKDNLSCTNNKERFDPSLNNEVVRFNSHDVNFIHQQFQSRLAQRNETPREFPDQESLRQWFDARQIAVFEERASRRLFVPMTEQEVAVAKASVERAASGIFPAPPRRFRLEWWAVLLVLFLGLQFIRSHPKRGADNTIEYRGIQFKMRKAYSSYEYYKDDPDNLDTNELTRIEQALTSAKVPSTFKDRDAVIHLMFDLQFPGYGMTSFGGSKADDGSVIEAVSVEIPQRSKDRFIVVRQNHGKWILVDDFVCGTTTNVIEHLKLEKETLRYYDHKGNLLREKHL